ncbi:hypothetical protein [Corynebacterium tuberculostearicum]|uniref:hypothetical protein n=1 Tax=Corynebacterium tuberculostearicum TaxID=38304 RepID=UPI0034643DE9
MNRFYTAANRAIFTLGQSKMLPEQLGRLDSKRQTPENAVLVVMALCLISAMVWTICIDLDR